MWANVLLLEGQQENNDDCAPVGMWANVLRQDLHGSDDDGAPAA